MIDTKFVSPHSMFLNYLRDVAVDLKENPEKWSIKAEFDFGEIKEDYLYYAILNSTEKTLIIEENLYYGDLFERSTLDGLIITFNRAKRFLTLGTVEIFKEISKKILEGLSVTGLEEQKYTIFYRHEEKFKEFEPYEQFFNFYKPKTAKDERLLEIYSKFISEDNIDNVIDEYPTFIADVIFNMDLHLDSLSVFKEYFSKTNILKSLVAFCEKTDFDRFSIIHYPIKMVELYEYIFESDDVSEDYKNKLKVLFAKSFFEKVVKKKSDDYYFTFGERFTNLFTGSDFEEFRNSHKENIQLMFEKSLVFLSEIEDDVTFNLYNDRSFNCLGAFEFVLLKEKLVFHQKNTKNYNDVVIKSVSNLIEKNDVDNINFIFSIASYGILNLFSGIGNFETNCKLDECSYRDKTNNFFSELRKAFSSLSKIIPEENQEELKILQLELDLYQKKFDLFYRLFE